MGSAPLPLTILIPAAGAARRMGGRDKLMEPVQGLPILRHVAVLCLTVGCPTWVLLPATGPFAEARRAALAGLPLSVMKVSGAEEGMGASLRAGAAQVPAGHAAMIVLPDMPGIGAPDLQLLITRFEEDPTRPLRAASAGGQPGNPVILPARLVPALRELQGDQGARGILQGESTRLCPLPAEVALTDLDDAESWARWRARP